MRTAHSLTVSSSILLGRGLPNPSLRMQTPLDVDSPGMQTPPHPCGQNDRQV